VDPQELELWEADALATTFTVREPKKGAPSPDLIVEAKYDDQPVGALKITLKARRDRVTFQADELPLDPPRPELMRLAKAVRRGDEVNVRYGSEHSISGRHVFPTTLKNVPFEFKTDAFATYRIEQEKPTTLAKIGEEKSLFCWTYHRYPKGWLVCDDGSMEIADFIHVTDEKDKPVEITLIHIKASHSEEADRDISVSAYEVVTSQALNNRRVWKDGAGADVKAFQAHMRSLAQEYRFKVIIIQPSLILKKAEKAKSDTKKLKVDQLKFLLASAEHTCQALGAKFEVFCSP
jgi:hypothetical protein